VFVVLLGVGSAGLWAKIAMKELRLADGGNEELIVWTRHLRLGRLRQAAAEGLISGIHASGPFRSWGAMGSQ